MQFKRSTQVAEALKREASDIIANHLKDPRLGFITVTGADMADDLRYAKIFISILGDDQARKKTLEGLESAKGFVRRELGHRLRLKFTPEIDFRIDESVATGDRIDRLLHQIAEEKKDGPG
jgi:ribosome-binding factor A